MPHHTDELVDNDDQTALMAACRLRGVDCSDARLIHHYSNAVYHLPRADLVVRVTRGHDAARRMRVADQVVRWLAERHDFPATTAAPALPPVNVEAHITVGFWTYYPQLMPASPLTSAHLGELLHRLHNLADLPPLTLDPWVPLLSLESTVSSDESVDVLSISERDWLNAQIEHIRDQLHGLDWPLGHGLIHGDAWAGNLLWNTSNNPPSPVLGDWDWVGIGPREVDLIPTWHAARRYGKGDTWTAAFVARYGYDLTTWPGFTTLLRMRDFVQLTGPIRRAGNSDRHRRVLRQRLDGIRDGNDTEVWTAL